VITNIDEIKAAISIEDIVSPHVKLKQKGKDFEGLCPFHNEKSPSFTIHQNKYKCFGCGKGGDGIDFLMEYKGLNYIEAIREIATLYSIEIEAKPSKPEKPIPRLETIPNDGIAFFEKRGISNNTIIRFGITETTEWMPGAKAEVRAICFNYFKDNELINIKFRAKNKDFKLNKNSELIFYNIDSIKDQTECVIVEGEMDCLSVYEAGIYNVVSVPNGAECKRLEYLNNGWQYFEKMTRIVILTDNDINGRKLQEELARRLGKDRCFRPIMKDDCKDANDILVKYGKGELAATIKNARQWPIDGVFDTDDLFEDISNYYYNGYPKGVEAGIGEFDKFLTFSGGQFTTVTGSPSAGKSEFIDYITTSLSRNHGWKWAVCSFENPPAFHATKLMEKFAGLSFAFRKDPAHRMQQRDFEQAVNFIDNYYKFINILQGDASLQGILNKCRELIIRTGIKGIVIDPWNYIEHKSPPHLSETQYISECLSVIKEFAMKYDVHIFLVAHPRKLTKDAKTGKYPIATMYDIAGSAHFFNKTDNGLSVHRDFEANITTVYIQKVRFSWLGKQGFATYTFDTYKRQYIQA
jgi:twinkle protein